MAKHTYAMATSEPLSRYVQYCEEKYPRDTFAAFSERIPKEGGVRLFPCDMALSDGLLRHQRVLLVEDAETSE